MPRATTRFAEIFCAVVEQGNYTAAAQVLGVTPAAVSRAVARYEAMLEARLIDRTTRSMTLTDAGRLYYERCRRALTLLEEAERVLAQQGPKVRLEFNVSNDNVDLVRDRYHLAVRRGELPDSTLVARKLEDASVGVFASPGYLARHGAPRHPEELRQHTCLPFVHPRTGRAIPWGFLDLDGRAQEFVPPDRLCCSGDFLGCVAMAKAGAGFVQAYRFLVEDELRDGALIEVLSRHAGLSSPFWLVRPARRGDSLAVRRLAEAIIAHCAKPSPSPSQ